jgi:hypothetical protein
MALMQQRVFPLSVVAGLSKLAQLPTVTPQLLHNPLTFLNNEYKTGSKEADSGPTTII